MKASVVHGSCARSLSDRRPREPLRYRILLVDDETAVTDGLRRALRREPYEILSAPSAQEALQLLARHQIDVVVSDEMIPGMRGSDLLGVVSREYPETMRIILTGHADLQTALRAINQGHIYRFLVKPCDDIELVVAIRQAIQHKELARSSRRLLKSFRVQNAVLQELETLHPGISDVKWDTSGAIEIPDLDSETDIDVLVNELHQEVAKAEARFRSHFR